MCDIMYHVVSLTCSPEDRNAVQPWLLLPCFLSDLYSIIHKGTDLAVRRELTGHPLPLFWRGRVYKVGSEYALRPRVVWGSFVRDPVRVLSTLEHFGVRQLELSAQLDLLSILRLVGSLLDRHLGLLQLSLYPVGLLWKRIVL